MSISAIARPAPVTDEDKATGNRKYLYPPTVEMFWSVTTVIGGTQDSSHFMGPWNRKLAAQVSVEYAFFLAEMRAVHGPVNAKDTKSASWLGGVNAVQFITGRVKELTEIKADAGKHVHAVIEALTLWAAERDNGGDILLPELPPHLVGALYDDEPIEDVIEAMVKGFIEFVVRFNPRFTATEATMFDPVLKVAGTADFRCEIDGMDVDDNGDLFASPGHVLSATVDTKSGKNLKWAWAVQVEKYRTMPLALAPMDEVVEVEPTKAAALLWVRPDLPNGFELRCLSKKDMVAARNAFGHARHTFLANEDNKKHRFGPTARWLTDAGTLSPVTLGSLAGIIHGSTLNPLRAALGNDATVDDVARFTEKDLLAIKGVGKTGIAKIAAMVAEYATPALAEVA